MGRFKMNSLKKTNPNKRKVKKVHAKLVEAIQISQLDPFKQMELYFKHLGANYTRDGNYITITDYPYLNMVVTYPVDFDYAPLGLICEKNLIELFIPDFNFGHIFRKGGSIYLIGHVESPIYKNTIYFKTLKLLIALYKKYMLAYQITDVYDLRRELFIGLAIAYNKDPQ